MNVYITQPPQHIAWCSGILSGAPRLAKSSMIKDLSGVFSDRVALKNGFAWRVVEEEGNVRVREVEHG